MRELFKNELKMVSGAGNSNISELAGGRFRRPNGTESIVAFEVPARVRRILQSIEAPRGVRRGSPGRRGNAREAG